MKPQTFPLTRRRRLEIAIALFLLLTLVLWSAVLQWTDKERDATAARKRTFAVAKVVDVQYDDAEAQDWTEGRRVGQQQLEVELLSGPWKGLVLDCSNYLSVYSNIDAREGTRIIVRLDVDDETQPYIISVPNYDRTPMLAGLLLIFAALLVIIGGKKGVMALLGLVYTLLSLWLILIPMVLRGADPILTAILIVALTTTASLFLLTGWSKKTLCASLGCTGGVAVAGLFAAAAGAVSPFNGFNMTEAEDMVLRAFDYDLHISGLFVSGILIASLGAVMDVAMSIASSCWELRELNPQLSRAALFRSGMNIGRDAMGTMANTLILAFAGSSLNTLLLLQVYDYPFIQIFNTDAIAEELIRGVAGSIGIILTVPLVAVLSSQLMKAGEKKSSH